MAKNNVGNTLGIFQKNVTQKSFVSKNKDSEVLESFLWVKMLSEKFLAETRPPKFLWVW